MRRRIPGRMSGMHSARKIAPIPRSPTPNASARRLISSASRARTDAGRILLSRRPRTAAQRRNPRRLRK